MHTNIHRHTHAHIDGHTHARNFPSQKERPVRVHWLNRPDNEQPWDHMLESDKRQTWEYFRKVKTLMIIYR